MSTLIHEELSNQIIGCFYEVYNTLGHGFLERVYENSLLIEFRNRGLRADQQRRIDVYYNGRRVGEYFADIVVEDSVIIELKAAEGIAPEHEAQLLNYLKATELELGFLFNFGPKAQFIRRVFANDRKTIGRG